MAKKKAKQMATIAMQCWRCKGLHYFDAPVDGLIAWQRGELIQYALACLNDGEREMFLSKTCNDCWVQMFGPPMEEYQKSE